MRVMVIVKASKHSEAGEVPGAQLLADMGRFNQELAEAGILVEGGGLRPSAQGARVTFSGRDRSVTRGPFGNTADLVAGFWIWNVNSLDDAIEWVKRCPNPMPERSDVEIRPMYEMEDFAQP